MQQHIPMGISMHTLPRPLRIIHTAADDVRDDPVAGVATAIRMPAFCLKSHYESPLGTHFRDLAWKTESEQQTIAFGTCELIIIKYDCTYRQLGVKIIL
jgi:hypothetical protein